MPTPYNPNNWYWIVANSTSQVYSSAVNDYVPVNNAAYQTWLAAGNKTTNIGDETSLGTVLAPYLLRPNPAGVLNGYTDAQAVKIITEIEFKIMFNHENRIRAIETSLGLNGSPPQLTPAQAKAAVKSLM